jgi:hypothetical protein
MSNKAGQLLWNRARITLTDAVTVIDTELQQQNKAFNNSSANEPPLGIEIAPPGPADGATPASRVQVIPLAPTPDWDDVTHGEPFVDPATNTVKVSFNNLTSPLVPVTINVLFWDPHTIVGPGLADTYNDGIS